MLPLPNDRITLTAVVRATATTQQVEMIIFVGDEWQLTTQLGRS